MLHPALREGPQARAEGAAARSPGHRLEEAVALARALPRLSVEGSEIVRLARPHPGHLFGTGKLDELKTRLSEAEIDLVLVDGPVTPVQQRNLERAWGVKLLDRTGLILEIFADRARTREGVLQVELAALSYQRTRLVRAWTHLERQRGGLGFVGGPGETQIEADRRAIDEQMVRLRRQLARVVRTRELHRAARARVPFPVVALVGYTNAGKSTLFNRVTGAEVMAKDMLFATLDPTMRALALPGGGRVILSDTVGFISDLPTELVAAFRATLEEVLEADLIVHVRDIAHPETDAQAADVEAVLEALGVDAAVPRLEVWNKIDALDPEMRAGLAAQAARRDEVFALSALTGEGLAPLMAAIEAATGADRHPARLTLPFEAGDRRAALHRMGVVRHEREAEDGWEIDVMWSEAEKGRFSGA
ncbi:GTP-binding protein HflX [Phaeovulum vinaykumarii]|uniref:GTPase HflX n=1 Tax=Phaeovulum vinaykumarii TaxID=407234 RepID=A0A1N7JIV5_9RHOB|nr:GTP-binding protein HflX [Phaeovulum vinaykumarii]SOB89510.1 GTP-binding protein HflX [Phaeovulum vinaykumarii]